MLKGVFKKKKIKTLSSLEVRPIKGCIVKCDLSVVLEHTGVYVGNGKIVSLNRHSQVCVEDRESFFPPWTNPKSNRIYTACYQDSDEVLSCKQLFKRAKQKVNLKTPYHVLFNNCHRFTNGCLTGDFENDVMSFAQLEESIFKNLEWLRPKKNPFLRFWHFILRKKESPQQPYFTWRPVVLEKAKNKKL